MLGTYNSLSRLKDAAPMSVRGASIDDKMPEQLLTNQNNVLLKYNGMKPRRKIRPVVHIGQNGEMITRMERKQHEHDYHFDKPIDKYFDDHKVNKLIYENKQEQ